MMTMLPKEEFEICVKDLYIGQFPSREASEKLRALLAHDQAQRAVIDEQAKELAWLKERDAVATWYETLITRAEIGTKDTPSLKAYIERIEAKIEQQAKEIKTLRELLRELHALVQGECPSLLNEDSGGDAQLALAIEHALKEVTT